LIYQYNSANFFPIDGRGFGNFYGGHNFGFTFVSNLRFTYQGFETFDFVGDDDVFVFINGMLALDLGGVHSAESATLDLTWPSGGCSQYNVDSSDPALPCATKNGQSSTPCACLLGLATGLYSVLCNSLTF
jgi:fibro-slime domain-containing protein